MRVNIDIEKTEAEEQAEMEYLRAGERRRTPDYDNPDRQTMYGDSR